MQTRKDDNAFPVLDSYGETVEIGISKREYFAGLALQGILANPEFMSTMAARVAVKKADELIIALNTPDE
jgi:hypothetical protein